MIDWLLGLINKRQQALYKENRELKAEIALLRQQLPFAMPRRRTGSVARPQRPPTPKPIDRSR